MTTPERLKPNDLLRLHGRSGALVLRLERYALAGWIAFFTLLAVFVLLIFVSTLAPKPVIAVDAAGRVLGRVEYLNPATRSDDEIIAGAEHFLDNYLSLNSATIFSDYAAALNMMTPALRHATLKALQRGALYGQGDYLARVHEAAARSRISFFPTSDGTRVLDRHGAHVLVRVRGIIHVYTGDNHRSKRAFDTTLNLTVVPRTTLDTAGLEISGIRDN